MVLLKSFFKFIVNPLAIIVAAVAATYLIGVFFKKGAEIILEFILDIISELEEVLGDSWLGKRYSGLIDAVTSIFE